MKAQHKRYQNKSKQPSGQTTTTEQSDKDTWMGMGGEERGKTRRAAYIHQY